VGPNFHGQVTALLAANNAAGPYHLTLVCTAQGLVVASAGDGLSDDDVAAFTCLFDDIVQRAVRDLGFHRVDEVTLLDPGRGRYVVRPLSVGGSTFFLVVRGHPHTSWRRNTTRLAAELERALLPLVVVQEGAA
jgi:hypothetical protein